MSSITPPTTPPMPQPAGAWWHVFSTGPVAPQPQPQDAPELLTPEAVELGQYGTDCMIASYMEEFQHTAIGLPEMTEDTVEKILFYFPDTIFPEPDDVPGSEPCSNTKAEEIWYKYFATMAMPRPYAPVPASTLTPAPVTSVVPIIHAIDEGYDSENEDTTVNALTVSFNAMDFDDTDFMDVVDYDEDFEEDSSFEDEIEISKRMAAITFV